MRDEWFIRGNVPMTKSEVRAVSLSKLELEPDSVLYDIGAGTGSVAVEAACLMPEGRVYAIERNQEAVELIRQNRKRSGRDNITIISGTAPEALKGLPMATHAFLGGTGGNMEEILTGLLEGNPSVRIVANVIALESLARLMEWIKKSEVSAEIVSVQVARASATAGYHLMKGQNPVYIISMGGNR